ncbi:hypothetical protein BDZ45DRAFT_449586 [Acephala macrosclerotiorum]|nr:hypothetical protein BDZ45DRAFT_449586 [Acephala macrosclerotiorum]
MIELSTFKTLSSLHRHISPDAPRSISTSEARENSSNHSKVEGQRVANGMPSGLHMRHQNWTWRSVTVLPTMSALRAIFRRSFALSLFLIFLAPSAKSGLLI